METLLIPFLIVLYINKMNIPLRDAGIQFLQFFIF